MALPTVGHDRLAPVGDVTGPSADFNRRWDLAWRSVPYPVVLISTGVVLWQTGTWTGALGTVALVVTLLAWHSWFVFVRADWPEAKEVPMVIYFAGYLVVGAVMAETGIVVVIAALPTAFCTLPGRWSYLGVAVTGTVLLLLGEAPPAASVAASIVAGVGMAALIGWGIRRLEDEAGHRQALNEELAASHSDLSTSHAALQEATAETARLQAEAVRFERSAAVAGERTRLAGELHDTLAQGVAGVCAQLETAEEVLEPEHPARNRVSTALRLARTTQVEARRSVHALRAGPLDEHELAGALDRTLAGWRERTGILANLSIVGRVAPLAADAEQALLRIVQEALTNVDRHSGAARVTVTLTYLEDQVALDVVDDGSGFDPASVPAPGPDGGHGLPSVRARAAALGGRTDVETLSGDGTALRVVLPLAAGEAR